MSITAHGFGVWEILWAFLRNRDALGFISEWAVPNLVSIPNVPYALMIGALLLATAKGKVEPRQLWLVVPFLLFGLTSGRALFPAALVLVPWAALAAKIPTSDRVVPVGTREAALNGFLAAMVVLAPLAAFLQVSVDVDPEVFPVNASRYLGSGNVWTDDAVGGYLIYADWPERRVLIDDRAELYGGSFMGRFVTANTGALAWKHEFASWGISQAITPSRSGLSGALDAAGWHRIYEDERWSVWDESEPQR